MEKIEADIFNILHNTKIRLQGDAEDNYGFMGKGYAEKLAIEIAKEIQPSEKKALSLNNIYEIIKRCDKNFNPEEDDEGDKHYIATLSEEFCDFMAKAIHSALPAQREVRYPEKREVVSAEDYGYNEAIDEFKKLNF